MEYKMNGERWKGIKAYLAQVWDSPSKYPDKALLLSLDEKEMSQIFTKKRLTKKCNRVKQACKKKAFRSAERPFLA